MTKPTEIPAWARDAARAIDNCRDFGVGMEGYLKTVAALITAEHEKGCVRPFFRLYETRKALRELVEAAHDWVHVPIHTQEKANEQRVRLIAAINSAEEILK